VLCGYDSGLCADVMKAFEQEVSRSLRHRAKEMLGLGSVKEAHTGSVLFIQRFDSALRLNVHAHLLSLDGVYVRAEEGALCFHELPEPSAEDVAEVARRTAQRLRHRVRGQCARRRESAWQRQGATRAAVPRFQHGQVLRLPQQSLRTASRGGAEAFAGIG
jgi:hypothetical protein